MNQELARHPINQFANPPSLSANPAVPRRAMVARILTGAFLGLAWGLYSAIVRHRASETLLVLLFVLLMALLIAGVRAPWQYWQKRSV